MKTQLLMLTAASLLLAGSASASISRPADVETQRYAERANQKAAALLAASGVDSLNAPVSVRARISLDGRVTRMDVVHTSGSRDTDRAVLGVLRKILVSDAPMGLLDGAVTLNVGQGAMVTASSH